MQEFRSGLSLLCLPMGRSGKNRLSPRIIRRMIEESFDILHKQGIQEVSNVILVGKLKSSVERNPAGQY